MKSTALEMSKTVRGLGDEAFVSYRIAFAGVIAQASADVGKRPTAWRIFDRKSDLGRVESGEVRALFPLQGRKLSKILRAAEEGRI